MSSSADYWKKRSEDRFKAAERTVEAQQEELTRFFDDALKDTQVVIRDFWARYAKDNKISYAEAQKLLNFEELREFKGDLKAFEKLAKSSIGTFNLELENLSTKSRITRYQALETQLKAVMENLTGKTEKMIQDTAGKVCEDSFYKTLFDIDQYRGFHEDFVGIDENLIREIISQPVAGATFSQSIWRNQQNLNYRVRQTLTEAMATGRNPYELSKEFAKEFNVGRYEAYRLLYTESAAVHTDAQMRAYKADGVKQYEIVATLDSKTSKICQEMDGKQFDVDSYQKGENCPPFHPWCRTTTAPVIEELEETGTRAARSKTTGKTVKVPAGMKYKDWKNKFIVNPNKTKSGLMDKISSPIAGKQIKIESADEDQDFIIVDERLLEEMAKVDSLAEERLPLASKYISGFISTDKGYLDIETSVLSDNNDSADCYIKMYFGFGKEAKDYDLLTKKVQRQVTEQVFFKGQDVRSLFIHEYTHAHLQGYVFEKLGMDLNDTSLDEWNLAINVYNELCFSIIRDAVARYPESYKDFLREIGGYGSSSEIEAIAQSIAKYYTVGSENDIVKAIVKKVEMLKC